MMLAGRNWNQREMPLQLLIWKLGYYVPMCFVGATPVVGGAVSPGIDRVFCLQSGESMSASLSKRGVY